MDEIIAFCGLSCHKCGAYLATKFNDNEKRKQVAGQWSKEYNANIKPEDINCEGCLSRSENVFNHCKVCEIRKCGIEKNIINCSACNDYACEKLVKFFEFVPDAKKQLDNIRANSK